MFFEDYLREQAVKEKTLQEGDYEAIYNAKISQLESYWAEAQYATWHKPKKPQQFI